MSYLMGVDIGGTIVKAAIYDMEGNEMAACGEKLTVLYPGHDMTERSIYQCKEKIFLSIKRAIEESGVDTAEIIGIGVTGQGNGAYMFDENGEPVHDGVMSSDTRANYLMRRWYSDGTYEKIYPHTMGTIWAGNITAIMAWFKENDEETLKKAKYVLPAKDAMRYILTGVANTELTEGSGMSAMDYDTMQYSQEVFDLMGIGEYIDRIPPYIGSCEVGGTITEEVAKATGLKAGTPVVGGAYDVCCSILSAGVTDEKKLGVVVGSWSINCMLSPKPVYDPKLFLQYVYALTDYIALLEGSSTSASNQEWFIDTCMERDADVYKVCNDLVESTPYRDTVMYLPFVYGSNVNIDAKGSFIGLKGEHGKAHMLRALYEGVVFCHKMHIDRLLEHCEEPEVIRMAGGATRSKVWMQMFADILGKDVEVSEASELGAMGAALCAGVGAGAFPDLKEAAVNWVKIKDVYEPDPVKHEYYLRKYEVYKKIIESLDGVWRDLDMLKE